MKQRTTSDHPPAYASVAIPIEDLRPGHYVLNLSLVQEVTDIQRAPGGWLVWTDRRGEFPIYHFEDLIDVVATDY